MLVWTLVYATVAVGLQISLQLTVEPVRAEEVEVHSRIRQSPALLANQPSTT